MAPGEFMARRARHARRRRVPNATSGANQVTGLARGFIHNSRKRMRYLDQTVAQYPRCEAER